MGSIKSSTKSLELKLRVTKPWLGDRRRKDIRTFDTEKVNGVDYMSLDLVRWRWAIREALDSIGVMADTDIDYIGLPAMIKAPAFGMYKRVWDPKNPNNREMFQCIKTGTLLTIPVTILSSLPETNQLADVFQTRPPTEEELKNCFSVIGNQIGLSPFGSHFGYGRFIVE